MLNLETGRLVLRDFTADDFESFYMTSNSPEYRRFYSEKEVTRAYWQRIFKQILEGTQKADRTAYQLAICLRSGELIGTCGVRIEDCEHQQGSFGCAIGEAYWGQGLAYEASKRILDFGFTEHGIYRVYAETISENRNARSLAERLGMRLEGELRQTKYFRGRWWDTAIYAILRDEWGCLHRY